MSLFPAIYHRVEFCVVGGGLSGLCAAVAAARHGRKTALLQERPMLGGNTSSEIRMWVCGAHGKNNRETGLVEELMLENYWRNPYKNYSIWDSVMLEMAKKEPNLEVYLNCTCMDGEMDEDRLARITGWQMTTQQYHVFEAGIFADCSGDSILAPITGALYRMGREGYEEYGEDIAPTQADSHTMGMSCMIQAREYPEERTFIAPTWARKFTKEDLPHRHPNLESDGDNFWYLELGGMQDTIRDTEEIRDELLRVAYGIWDFLKNDPENQERNKCFDIDWIGILPGKRESRRYVGDYVMTQSDVRAGGHFDDLVAYGGWSMDDHHPGGIDVKEPPTIYHPAPSPYGIPYRCLYSQNVKNLMFAGRNISVSHVAMSSTRVMATCALLGQAVGTAAAIALREGITPRGIYEKGFVPELQQTLMEDDCYLPYHRRALSPLTREARLESNLQDAENLRNGYDRPIGDADNGARGPKGSFVTYTLDTPQWVEAVRLVLDSDLNRETLPEREMKLNRGMRHNIRLCWEKSHMPTTVVKDLDVMWTLEDGSQEMQSLRGNHQRLVWIPCRQKVAAVTIRLLDTWGSEECHLFAVDLME
ncbi:FAD-dependent oxidoreductase [Bianquea renquensis]|uniref:FAD-dependent oxidoreductase n=1 Tax=Bianquea renquensis TaxID=2763661 RepID=A0A926I1J9_9FIRM|nr:FAD-dependent oxidoreductase [Bianquea renquensis]MBC8543528.1 FAD-dependent oxidoreductase [Bianquea renquensis]